MPNRDVSGQLYSLHPGSTFEGFYSKFTLPSGARIVLIPCTVPAAKQQAHSITFVYIPPSSNQRKPYQVEIRNEQIDAQNHDDGGFSFTTNTCTPLKYQPAQDRSPTSFNEVHYDLKHGDLRFRAFSYRRTPWSSNTDSPEGLLGWLPLPLHWYVHSFSSVCRFQLNLPDHYPLPKEDQRGACRVHEEKNWANSFPSAHHWVLGRKEEGGNTISLAGGRTLGLDAYLAGYRNPELNLELDFRPPFALKVLGISPFLTVTRDWDQRHFTVDICNTSWRIQVHAVAPKESFFRLSEPFPEGFRENWLAQSLDAVVSVRVWRRRWRIFKLPPWEWEVVCTDVFEDGGMEFGGEYYPERG